MGILGKFKTVIAELGPLDACLYVFNKLLEGLSGGKASLLKYYFVVQPVKPEPVIRNASRRKLVIQRVLRDDPLIEQFPRPRNIIEQRYRQNGICYAALKGESFIGYIWFNEGMYREDEVRCNFLPMPEGDMAWDYDVYVDPAHRLSLAFPLLWDRANEHLREGGFASCASRISAYNANSLAVHTKLGAHKAGSAVFLALGHLQLMLSTLSPFINVSRAHRPVLKVRRPRNRT